MAQAAEKSGHEHGLTFFVPSLQLSPHPDVYILGRTQRRPIGGLRLPGVTLWNGPIFPWIGSSPGPESFPWLSGFFLPQVRDAYGAKVGATLVAKSQRSGVAVRQAPRRQQAGLYVVTAPFSQPMAER